jgi:flagellar protein FlbD
VIQLTRLNNKPLFVNSDLIKLVEQSPDTVMTLISGEKIVVRESAEEIRSRIVAFRRFVLQGLSLSWDASPSHTTLPQFAGDREPEPEK